MHYAILAKTTSWILKPLAWVLSFAINGIYYVVSLLTQPQSIALTIFLMTLFIRILMTPLTVKQQKSSRKMQRLQPQQQAITEKYKNKTDPEAQQKMQEEINKLYQDNQTSPFAGCLPLLIQMPILFALYEILRNIPFYVNQISAIYDTMVGEAQAVGGITDILKMDVFATAVRGIKNWDAATADGVKDFLYHLTGDQWAKFFELTKLDANSVFYENYLVQKSIHTLGGGFFTWNLTGMPSIQKLSVDWIMPILAAALTLASSLIMDAKNKKRSRAINPNYKEDETQKSTKLMLYISPIMILVFGFQVPIGLCFYWIVSSFLAIVSQEIVDAYLDKQEYKEALAKRAAYQEKQELNRAMYGKNAGFNSAWEAANKTNKSSMAGNKATPAKKKDEVEEAIEEAKTSVAAVPEDVRDELN